MQAALWGSLLEEYRDKINDLKDLHDLEKKIERARSTAEKAAMVCAVFICMVPPSCRSIHPSVCLLGRVCVFSERGLTRPSLGSWQEEAMRAAVETEAKLAAASLAAKKTSDV